MKIPALLVIAILLTSLSPGQDKGDAKPDLRAEIEEKATTLESVSDSISLLDLQIEHQRKALSDAATDQERARIEEKIADLMGRRDKASENFRAVASGVGDEGFETIPGDEFDLRDEVDELLEPLVGELKDLTARPREMEDLRGKLAVEKSRFETARQAAANIETLLARGGLTPETAARLEQTRTTWNDRLRQSENRVQLLSYRVEELDRSNPSVFATAREGIRSFFRTRGMNFALSIGAFLVVFIGLRFLHRRLHRHSPWHRPDRRTFPVRLVDVIFHILTFAGAIAASLLVLYAAGDWVLLGLAIIVLGGVALAAKSTIPRFYEQGRLLLNLGEVREGERVIYRGIPWKVERLRFFTTLVNPSLTGGRIRLPLRNLPELLSRRAEDGEPWFPCEKDDWVELSDGKCGRIEFQTPEAVGLVQLGGARLTYRTEDFVALAPNVLSGQFRVSTTFGIDYQYQNVSTTEVPETLEATIREGLIEFIGDKDLLNSLKVEFKSAAASSLDYEIIADLDGRLAHRKEALRRALQRFAVECCNENGWEIPFTQITVHQAQAEPDREPDMKVVPRHSMRARLDPAAVS